MSFISYLSRCIAIVLFLLLLVVSADTFFHKPQIPSVVGVQEPQVIVNDSEPVAVSEKSDINQELLMAIRKNDLEATKVLIHAGADVNSKDETGWRPLTWAVCSSPEMTRLLIQSGAKIDGRNNGGETALFWASGDLIPLLLQQGADIEAVATSGETALLKAAYSCGSCACGSDPESVKVLLAHGANPNIRNHDGETALLRAASAVDDSGSLKAIRLLLAKGAKVNARNHQGKTALSLIRENLKEYNANDEYSRESRTTLKQEERLLLRAGARE